MADKTKIGWTDASWPVVTGCTHLSEGCDHCYAAKLTSGRLKHQAPYAGLAENGRFNGNVRLLWDRLDWPRHWRKPRRIFVSDMADLFHQDVPEEFILAVFGVMAQTPQHTYQVLTKRHARMRSLLSSEKFAADLESILWQLDEHTARRFRWPLPNIWAGVSCENEKWARTRIPALLDTPAAVRFISAEPLLGPIGLHVDLLVGMACEPPDGIGWVIAGGESGPGHRQMDVEWLTSLGRQCRDAGVPFFAKQDSGPRAGQQGRIPDEFWIHEFPSHRQPAATSPP